MKTHFIFLTTLFVCTTAFSQDTDKHLVERTLSYYLDGGTNNDFNTLKKAFHPNASMKFISQGEYKEVNALEFFERGMKSGTKQDRKTTILTIDINGMVAQAKLKIEYSSFYFIDYMNLLKVDREWKIVGKVFHRHNK